MTPSSYRAWGFVHPDFDAAEGQPGLRVSPRGGAAMVSGAAAVRQSVLILLSTRPGERVMRPRYGCDLNRLVFSPNDATTAGLAIHYVRQALLRWEPRIEILGLDAGPGETDPGRLDIVLEYRVRSLNRPDRLIYPFDLTGTAA
jgi:phage baseplate assembly protein W